MTVNPRACPRCNGARTVRETKRENGVYRDATVTCPRCHGTGRQQ